MQAPGAPRKCSRSSGVDISADVNTVCRCLFTDAARVHAFSFDEDMYDVEAAIDKMQMVGEPRVCTFITKWSIRFGIAEPGKDLASSKTTICFEVHDLPVAVDYSNGDVTVDTDVYTIDSTVRTLVEVYFNNNTPTAERFCFHSPSEAGIENVRQRVDDELGLKNLTIDWSSTAVSGPYLTTELANDLFQKLVKYYFP